VCGYIRGMTTHLVWDWNGTLLDDFELTVAATNAAFALCAGPRITGDQHRRMFRRPVQAYYAQLLGRPIDDDEFSLLDKAFHDEYHGRLDECRLSEGAVEALSYWARLGATQSLLSMWFHDKLVPFVAGFGLTDHFLRIDGLRQDVGGGGKADHLVAHLAAIGVAGADCVLIGDTLDDAAAAHAVGARCVLVTGGFTDADRLRATGLPVADSLYAAVALAHRG
jgi:phosphoglycolate phosphatase-like HAD superfamily hydrolase